MNGKLAFFLADPRKKVFETPTRQVILVGAWEKGLPDSGRFIGLPAMQAIRLLAEYENDGCCLLAEKDADGNLSEIFAYRGPSAAYELYFAADPEGEVFLSDLFGKVLESLPNSRRALSREAFLDFLALQNSPLPETPVTAIRRLGQGDLLCLDRNGAARVSRFSRLRVPESPADFRDGAERIEQALSRVVKNLPKGVVNLLSGGIDSTLAQVLLGPGTGAVTASIDSPEFAFERDYAAQAAALCGVSRQEIPFSEEDFHSLLERETALARLPLSLPQIPVIAGVLDCPPAHFSSGFNADSFFSLSRSKRKLVREGTPPDSFPVESFSVSSEKGLLEGLFGREAVEERICIRNEYARSRVEEPENLSSLNWGCLASYCCSSFPRYRQSAVARGKTLDSLFMGRSLVEEALAFPAQERIFRQGIFKPVLKALLARRLPAYPLEIEKGGAGLPRTRFCQSGPLRGYFRENPLPGFIDEEKADPILNPGWESSMTTFRCIAWSAWEKTLKAVPVRANR